MTESMNLALGVNFNLLDTNLSAMFEKDDEGSKILLLPTKVDSPNPVKLGKMVEDFQKAFGMKDGEEIKSSLTAVAAKKEGSTFNPDAITFKLQSAFFYKNMPKQAAADAQNAATQTAGETEYAFAVSVDMADALPDLGFAKLNSMFIAVWNTERETVLQQIGTGKITHMLTNLGV